MSIDERQRHELYEGLVEALGADRADTLMALVPPVGWADVATKHDLSAQDSLLRSEVARVEEVLSLRMEAMESRLRADMHLGQRNLLLGIFGSVMTAAVLNQVLAAIL